MTKPYTQAVLQAATLQVHAAVAHFMAWCQHQNLAPGLAAHAAIDFLANMVAHNSANAGQLADNLTDVIGRLRARAYELAQISEVPPDTPTAPRGGSNAARSRPRPGTPVQPRAQRSDRATARRRRRPRS